MTGTLIASGAWSAPIFPTAYAVPITDRGLGPHGALGVGEHRTSILLGKGRLIRVTHALALDAQKARVYPADCTNQHAIRGVSTLDAGLAIGGAPQPILAAHIILRITHAADELSAHLGAFALGTREPGVALLAPVHSTDSTIGAKFTHLAFLTAARGAGIGDALVVTAADPAEKTARITGGFVLLVAASIVDGIAFATAPHDGANVTSVAVAVIEAGDAFKAPTLRLGADRGVAIAPFVILHITGFAAPRVRAEDIFVTVTVHAGAAPRPIAVADWLGVGAASIGGRVARLAPSTLALTRRAWGLGPTGHALARLSARLAADRAFLVAIGEVPLGPTFTAEASRAELFFSTSVALPAGTAVALPSQIANGRRIGTAGVGAGLADVAMPVVTVGANLVFGRTLRVIGTALAGVVVADWRPAVHLAALVIQDVALGAMSLSGADEVAVTTRPLHAIAVIVRSITGAARVALADGSFAAAPGMGTGVAASAGPVCRAAQDAGTLGIARASAASRGRTGIGDTDRQ